jgi:hypothetical protein
VALVTIQNLVCLAARLTDRTIKPSFCGERHRLLVAPPADSERWAEYISLRQADSLKGDRWGRTAHAYYLVNRAAMDAGAEISDPYRFVADVLPDGSQVEVSALQAYFNFIADKGEAAALCELDNDPPAEIGPQSSGISAALVESRLHGYPHQVVPEGAETLTIGVDIGIYRLHWVAIAWRPQAIGFIVDYDQADVVGCAPEDKQLSAEHAILRALVNLRDQFIQNPFVTEAGQIVAPKLVLIDSGSGLHTNAVYQFCRSVGHRPFVPAKGFARGGGASPFYLGKHSATRRIGDNWFAARQENAPDIWLHGFDADFWKRFVHQRFLTPTFDDDGQYRAGTLSLWRSKQTHRHAKFARQIEAEVWVSDFEEGRAGIKEYWERRHRDNHYLDACAMACVGGSMAGVRLLGAVKPRKTIPLNEMARRAGSAA